MEKPAQTVANAIFYIQQPTPTREHAHTISQLPFLEQNTDLRRSDARKLYSNALMFAMSLRETLANWWPFRIGDGVGVVIPEKDSMFEFLAAVLGTWMAGGTVVLFNAALNMDKVYKVQGIRVLVCPSAMSKQFPFPTIQYGSRFVEDDSTRALQTRTVSDMILRGENLEPILLPIFAKKDIYHIALIHEHADKLSLTHRQVVQRIQSTAIIPEKDAVWEARELDPRKMTESPEILIDVLLSALYMSSRGYSTSTLVFKQDEKFKPIKSNL